MSKIDDLLERLDTPMPSCRAMREAAAAIRALREALEPFADAADGCIDDADDDAWHTWEHPIGLNVTIADYRRAALASHDGREG